METNQDKTIKFFNLEHQKLKYIIRNENDNCSCYVAKVQKMQCKHMIRFNIVLI